MRALGAQVVDSCLWLYHMCGDEIYVVDNDEEAEQVTGVEGKDRGA